MTAEYRKRCLIELAAVENRSFSLGVIAIFTSPDKGQPMTIHDEIYAKAGTGLQGDRYALRRGAFSGTKRVPDEDRQISIISIQGIQDANAELVANGNNEFDLSETRRNIVIDLPVEELNALVGKRFRIGGVIMEGSELCTPCVRPSVLAKKPGFKDAFKNRGGLRARIIKDGQIWTGDYLSTIS